MRSRTSAAGAETLRLMRCLRARLAPVRPGGFGNPLWGYYGPCARSSLTARFHHGHASADRGWGAGFHAGAERRQWSAGRRAVL